MLVIFNVYFPAVGFRSTEWHAVFRDLTVATRHALGSSSPAPGIVLVGDWNATAAHVLEACVAHNLSCSTCPFEALRFQGSSSTFFRGPAQQLAAGVAVDAEPAGMEEAPATSASSIDFALCSRPARRLFGPCRALPADCAVSRSHKMVTVPFL